MEDYSHTNNNNNQMNDNSNSGGGGGGGGTPRGSFLYASPVIGGGGGNSSSSTPFHLLNSATTNSTLGFHPDQQQQLVKTESSPASKFHHYSLLGDHHHHHRHHHHHQYQHQQQQQHQQQVNSNNNNNNTSRENSSNTTNNNNSANSGGGGVGGGVVGEVDALKAKIVSHPHYSNLLLAYMDCQKVGAPAEVVARLAAARQEFESRQTSSSAAQITNIKDPELDQFMEAYYDMLVKYREELTRPIQEAMEFMRRVETQLNLISTVPLRVFNNPDDKSEGWGGGGGGSSEEEQENCSGGETELPEIDPRAEDRELKNHLLRKYSGYLSSLKQELSKKKKKGKLPKEARQKLLSWWELHYKWPYPSESEKVALAETTGLDQKQINNWFINQRKRHWKPSEDMQFMVMDGLTHHPPHHPHHHNPAAALYMDAHHHYLPDGPYRLGP